MSEHTALVEAVAAAFERIEKAGPTEVMRQDERAAGYRVVLPGEEPWLSAEDWPDHITVSTDGHVVRIVAIIANNPGGGAFSRLVGGIIAAGMTPVVVCPFTQMRAILERWGWQYNTEDQWSPAEQPPSRDGVGE